MSVLTFVKNVITTNWNINIDIVNAIYPDKPWKKYFRQKYGGMYEFGYGGYIIFVLIKDNEAEAKIIEFYRVRAIFVRNVIPKWLALEVVKKLEEFESPKNMIKEIKEMDLLISQEFWSSEYLSKLMAGTGDKPPSPMLQNINCDFQFAKNE